MQHDNAKHFTHSHTVFDDGTVTFKCSTDETEWPWLALAPTDPIVVQSLNYWVSVETGTARGSFDTQKWSALTETDWVCGDSFRGHATHGVALTSGNDEKPRFILTLFDSGGAVVYHLTGRGVIFRTRDFESWRAKKKSEEIAPPDISDFQFAPADSVGVAHQDASFVSPLIDGETRRANALITKEKGLMPCHPYHGGSGDHVNANHLADIGAQFLSLLLGGQHFTVTSGAMQFTRYVELDRPFSVELVPDGFTNRSVSMIMHQSGRACTSMSMTYTVNDA